MVEKNKSLWNFKKRERSIPNKLAYLLMLNRQETEIKKQVEWMLLGAVFIVYNSFK